MEKWFGFSAFKWWLVMAYNRSFDYYRIRWCYCSEQMESIWAWVAANGFGLSETSYYSLGARFGSSLAMSAELWKLFPIAYWKLQRCESVDRLRHARLDYKICTRRVDYWAGLAFYEKTGTADNVSDVLCWSEKRGWIGLAECSRALLYSRMRYWLGIKWL
jgi:hypothetical protein